MGSLGWHRADESLDSARYGKRAQFRRNLSVFVEAAIALRGALWAPSGAGCRGAAGSGYYERIIVRGKQPTATGGYTFSGKSGHNDRARPRGYPGRLGWGRRISTVARSTAQLFLAGVAAVGDDL
jgi:hypothetical protein